MRSGMARTVAARRAWPVWPARSGTALQPSTSRAPSCPVRGSTGGGGSSRCLAPRRPTTTSTTTALNADTEKKGLPAAAQFLVYFADTVNEELEKVRCVALGMTVAAPAAQFFIFFEEAINGELETE